jgi:predicted nucleotidyltransferase
MKIKLRNMLFSHSSVNSLKNSALVPEVSHTLVAWAKSKTPNKGVLIGGLAMSFYSKPRYTEDVDLLFIDLDLPKEIPGFARNQTHALTNKKTHVEVELVTPELVNVPSSVFKKVVATAKEIDGLKVASVEGLIVLKLFGSDSVKRESQDTADIERLVESKPDVDLSDWSLSQRHLSKFEAAKLRALS